MFSSRNAHGITNAARLNPPTNASNYYTSQAWETTITNASNTYHPVKQPTNTNRIQTLLQLARQPSQTSQTSQDQPVK